MPVRFLILVVMLAAGSIGTQHAQAPSAARQLPPLSWTCPMHPDVLEVEKGACPVCRMALEPVRLDTVWSCAIHQVVQEGTPGVCPVCRRALVPLTMAFTWTCASEPGVRRTEPGTCSDGTDAVATRTLRPHGNHNPQHGGLFFMAPDNWHHLEGTYPEPGVFRLYLYDDYSRPLPADRLKQVTGRVVTGSVFDPVSQTTRELAAYALAPEGDGNWLEARIDSMPLPARITARIALTPGAGESRFDFTFSAYSREATAEPSSPASGESGVADPIFVPRPVPATVNEILSDLRERTEHVKTLIDRGDLSRVYFPAFQGKELALALLARSGDLPADRRRLLDAAVARLVRAAWLIDAHGDSGNLDEVLEAYARFSAAVYQVEAMVR
jgi:hypothetical protein